MGPTEFTGLVQETPEQRAAWKAEQIQLPPCAGQEVPETLFAEPPNFMRIENQQRTNMCAVNAGTSTAEKLGFMLTGEMVELSRNYLYAKAQKYCGLFGDRGVTLGSVIKALKQDGCPPEQLYPFNGTFNPQIPPGCDAEAAIRKATATIDVERGGYDAVRTVIGQNMGAVLFASYWPIQYAGGYVVEKYLPVGRGGHARTWLFLSTRKDDAGRPFVWAANSHSTAAQHKGWELWSPAAVAGVIQRDEWGATGLTDMTTPKPRKFNWTGVGNPFAK